MCEEEAKEGEGYGGAGRGFRNENRIMDLVVLTKTWSFVLSYPVPFWVPASCFISSPHVPISLFHS